MCGRASLAEDAPELRVFLRRLRTDLPDWYRPRYNIAPSQEQMVIVQRDGVREARSMKWGLVPFWAKDPKIGYSMINARAETVATKPAYREALKRRRGLLVADSFYEWRKNADGSKTPFRIHRPGGEPFTMAALWERWGPKEEQLETCTIITTSAAGVMKPLHERMPVIIPEDSADAWLDPDTSPVAVGSILARASDDLEAYPVSQYLNSPRNEGANCWERNDGVE